MNPTQFDDFARGLAALQQRWNDRISGKDLRVIGEAYRNGRIAIALHFDAAISESGQWKLPSGLEVDFRDVDLIVVLVANDDIPQAGYGESGNNQIVLVEVVGFSDLPNQEISSTIGFYLAKKQEGESGARLHYSTISWTSLLARGGRCEGGLKRFPGFINWEVYPRRLLATGPLGPHYATGDIVKGGIKIMETVANGERQVGWKLTRLDVDFLASALQVRINHNTAEVALSDGLKDRVRLLEVAVGPLDL